MAWRSSGETNNEMCDQLNAFGVITSPRVLQAFRMVDRSHFVPSNLKDEAYNDQPLKTGNIHLSAPHIYGTAMDALDLTEGMSFLNVGSGTGYINTVAAYLGGSGSVNHGIEYHKDVYDHSKKCIEAFTKNIESKKHRKFAYIEVCHGNIFDVKAEECIRYDRIYIGAQCPPSERHRVSALLTIGGILVGPIGDELLKVIRVNEEEFTQVSLACVRFAPLVRSISSSPEPIVLPRMVWTPDLHEKYPDTFKQSVRTILLITTHTNAPPSRLVHSLWVEILSFTNRTWFVPEQTEMENLMDCLNAQIIARKEAEKLVHEAKRRRRDAERERDMYRHLARHLHLQLQNSQGSLNREEDPFMALIEANMLASADSTSDEEEENADA